LIRLVPFGQDPLAVTATELLDRYQDRLPDLSACQVLVAYAQCAPQLRAELLRQAADRGHQALLGPGIVRLDAWLIQFADNALRVLDRPALELVLAEALHNAGALYADTDPWLLSDQLLALFDELTRNQVSVADAPDSFSRLLNSAYGMDTP